MDFDNLVRKVASELADMAGSIICQHYKKLALVEKKPDMSPVTIADREAEAAMRRHLTQAFPDHGIIGEELGVKNPRSPYQWVLDPIDGTRAYIEGRPTFTTLIGLAHKKIPILGVIDQPTVRKRWCSWQKSGKTSGVSQLKNAAISTTSTDYFNKKENKKFEKLKKSCREVTLGGDGFSYGQLASGRMDVVIDVQLKPYDFCALPPIVEAAGGIITDWKGKPLTLASDGRVIAAASAKLHKEVLAVLSG